MVLICSSVWSEVLFRCASSPCHKHTPLQPSSAKTPRRHSWFWVNGQRRVKICTQPKGSLPFFLGLGVTQFPLLYIKPMDKIHEGSGGCRSREILNAQISIISVWRRNDLASKLWVFMVFMCWGEDRNPYKPPWNFGRAGLLSSNPKELSTHPNMRTWTG